jgi:hypothetical protein
LKKEIGEARSGSVLLKTYWWDPEWSCLADEKNWWDPEWFCLVEQKNWWNP